MWHDMIVHDTILHDMIWSYAMARAGRQGNFEIRGWRAWDNHSKGSQIRTYLTRNQNLEGPCFHIMYVVLVGVWLLGWTTYFYIYIYIWYVYIYIYIYVYTIHIFHELRSSGSSIPVGDRGSKVRMVGSLLIRLMNLRSAPPTLSTLHSQHLIWNHLEVS